MHMLVAQVAQRYRLAVCMPLGIVRLHNFLLYIHLEYKFSSPYLTLCEVPDKITGGLP
jgi:hypothetical protein